MNNSLTSKLMMKWVTLISRIEGAENILLQFLPSLLALHPNYAYWNNCIANISKVNTCFQFDFDSSP